MSPPSSFTVDQQSPGLLASMARYWRLSLVIVIVVAGVTYGVSLTFPKRYEATASVELTDPGSAGVFQTRALMPDDFTRYTSRQGTIIQSAAVAQEVVKSVKGVSSSEYYSNVRVNASTPGLLILTARAKTAAGASDLANATTKAYKKVTADSSTQATNAALSAIGTSIYGLAADFARVTKALAAKPNDRLLQATLQGLIGDRGTLSARANELRVNQDAFGDGVTFVDPAREPTKPAEPQPLRNAGIAALLALLAAGVLAWIRADRHQAADDSAAPAPILDAPMLGSIPSMARDEDMAAVSDGGSVAAESYQYVAASLQHLFKWGVLLVTSASRGDGKTVSAASIAAAAARDGTRVVLVDADARASTLTRRMLGAAERRPIGLTDLAEGTTELEEAYRLLPLDDGVLLPFVAAGSHDGKGGLFRTPGMAQTLQRMRETYDLIVVDTAALLAVADVASLAVNADGIVVVVSRGTALHALESVRQRLDLVGAPLVGYVFTFAEEEPEPYLQVPSGARNSSEVHRRRRPGLRIRRKEARERDAKAIDKPRRPQASASATRTPEGNGAYGGALEPQEVDDLL